MVDGPNQYSGRVEIYNIHYHSSLVDLQQWGTICDIYSQWTVEDATVVCRSLGYQFNEANLQINQSYGLGTRPIWTTYIRCTGDEFCTWECSLSFNYGSSPCDHSMDIGIICSGKLFICI